MATAKKLAKGTTKASRWNLSWRQLLIAASVTANIAFIVVVVTMMSSHALDGMFMNEGLNRYCNTANDEKFSDTTDRTKALRTFTCARGDAKQYFDEGFQKYLDFKAIPAAKS